MPELFNGGITERISQICRLRHIRNYGKLTATLERSPGPGYIFQTGDGDQIIIIPKTIINNCNIRRADECLQIARIERQIIRLAAVFLLNLPDSGQTLESAEVNLFDIVRFRPDILRYLLKRLKSLLGHPVTLFGSSVFVRRGRVVKLSGDYQLAIFAVLIKQFLGDKVLELLLVIRIGIVPRLEPGAQAGHAYRIGEFDGFLLAATFYEVDRGTPVGDGDVACLKLVLADGEIVGVVFASLERRAAGDV